jgi:hypothetical protein
LSRFNVMPRVLRRNREPAFSANVATLAQHALARNGIELNETHLYTDEQLLEMATFGKKSLAWIRYQETKR